MLIGNFTTTTGSKLDQIALKDDGQLWIEFSVVGIAGTTKRYRITEIAKMIQLPTTMLL